MGRMGSGALIADAIPFGVALGDRGALFDRNRLTGE
jgi:hypothetical protein